jgi:hypothetical protein
MTAVVDKEERPQKGTGERKGSRRNYDEARACYVWSVLLTLVIVPTTIASVLMVRQRMTGPMSS